MFSLVYEKSETYILGTREKKNKRVHAPYKPDFKGNPSRATFRSLPVSEYQEGLALANHVTLISLTGQPKQLYT